ncbi:DUF1000-domain-containing protein [Gyrodon lividus]|nr:DUF1000-domain-containing protein [Gyrodon lividus]
MPHHHLHHHNEGCDHDHDQGDVGPNDNLFPYIDRPNVIALNATEPGSSVIKPWHERTSTEVYLESDADEQLIIRVPFTGSVRLRSLLLKAGPGELTPEKIALFANESSLDFSDVQDKTPTQEFEVAEGRDVGEYAIKTAKFSNLSSVTLFIPSNRGAAATRVYYIGFLGHWTERKSNPVVTVYETQANLADHQKIRGMDGNFSTPQT